MIPKRNRESNRKNHKARHNDGSTNIYYSKRESNHSFRGIREEDVYIENGIITETGRNLTGRDGAEEMNAAGLFVLPGFRDQHMHHMYGQLEADTLDEAAIARRAGEVARAKAKDGVAKFCMAMFGGTLLQMEKYMRGLKRYMDSPENGKEGARLLGAFVEGTFINSDCRGRAGA